MFGSLSVKTTVLLSVFLTSLTYSFISADQLMPGFSLSVLTVYTRSSALNSTPSLHITPGRSLTVIWVASALYCGLSAGQRVDPLAGLLIEIPERVVQQALLGWRRWAWHEEVEVVDHAVAEDLVDHEHLVARQIDRQIRVCGWRDRLGRRGGGGCSAAGAAVGASAAGAAVGASAAGAAAWEPGGRCRCRGGGLLGRCLRRCGATTGC